MSPVPPQSRRRALGFGRHEDHGALLGSSRFQQLPGLLGRHLSHDDAAHGCIGLLRGRWLLIARLGLGFFAFIGFAPFLRIGLFLLLGRRLRLLVLPGWVLGLRLRLAGFLLVLLRLLVLLVLLLFVLLLLLLTLLMLVLFVGFVLIWLRLVLLILGLLLVLVLVLLLLPILLLLAEFLDLSGDQVAIELGICVLGIEFQAAVVVAQGVFPMSQRVGGG